MNMNAPILARLDALEARVAALGVQVRRRQQMAERSTRVEKLQKVQRFAQKLRQEVAQ